MHEVLGSMLGLKELLLKLVILSPFLILPGQGSQSVVSSILMHAEV